MKGRVGCFAVLLCLARAGSLAAASPDELWRQARTAYEEGEFQEAARLYEELASDWPGGWVFYNLGNARFKAGQLGEAVLAYKRAKWLLPRSREVEENLSQAQRAVGMEKTGPPGVGLAFRDALHVLTEAEWLLVFSLFFAPGVLAGICWTWTRTANLRTAAFALIGAAAIVLSVVGLRVLLDMSYAEAVVVADEGFGFVAPHAGEDKAFRTTAGNLVYPTKRESADWTEVSLTDGTRGWMRNQDFVAVTEWRED